MARNTVTRLADSAAGIGYQNGWNDATKNIADAVEEIRSLEKWAKRMGFIAIQARLAAVAASLQKP